MVAQERFRAPWIARCGAHASGKAERPLGDARLDVSRKRCARAQPIDRLRFRQAMVRGESWPAARTAQKRSYNWPGKSYAVAAPRASSSRGRIQNAEGAGVEPIWQPTEDKIENAQITQFARQLRAPVPARSQHLSGLLSLDGREPGRVLERGLGLVRRHRLEEGLDGAGRRRPDARREVVSRGAAQFRREPAAARRPRRCVRVLGRDGLSAPRQLFRPVRAMCRARCRRCSSSACARAIAPRRSCRTCRRRRCSRSRRLRRASCGRRARRTSASKACSIASARSSRRSCSAPTAIATTARSTIRSTRVARDRRAAADAAQDRGGAAPSTRGRRRRRCRRRCCSTSGCGAITPGAIAYAQLPFDHPLLHPVHLGHHRQAQVHRARRRRHAAAAPEDVQAAVRRAAGDRFFYYTTTQLGDVEPAVRRPRRRGERDALRRLAVRSATATILFDYAEPRSASPTSARRAKFLDAIAKRGARAARDARLRRRCA